MDGSHLNFRFSFPQLNKPMNKDAGGMPLLSVSEKLSYSVQIMMVMERPGPGVANTEQRR